MSQAPCSLTMTASQPFTWIRGEVQRSYNTKTPVTGILQLMLDMGPGGDAVQRSRARRFILKDIVPQALSQGTIQLGQPSRPDQQGWPEQQIFIVFSPASMECGGCTLYLTKDTRPDPVKMQYVARVVERLNQALSDVAGHQTLGAVGRASLGYLFSKPLDTFPVEQRIEIHIPSGDGGKQQ